MQNKSLWTYLLLCSYLLIALFISLAHNHEEDLIFHDDCPACQWEVQAKDTDTATLAVWSDIVHPPEFSEYFVHYETHRLSNRIIILDFPSRPPPVS